VKNGVYHSYKASLNDTYRRLKSNDLFIRLEECGLIKEIEEQCTPNCIVLYGSGVEGRDDERGDIDLFIQSKEQKMDISPYEKSLKRKISLLFEPSMDKLESGLKNTLANGIVLRGFLKVI
jgi:predicted nucleotidyltransferase